MKKKWKKKELALMIAVGIWLLGSVIAERNMTDMSYKDRAESTTAVVAEHNKIPKGIYVEGMDLSDLNIEEAKTKVKEWGEAYLTREFTFFYADGKEMRITPAEAGVTWQESDYVEALATYGKKGNVVSRYKVRKDLSRAPLQKGIPFAVDTDVIRGLLEEQSIEWNSGVQEPFLSRENGVFTVHSGVEGTELDMETSIADIVDFFTGEEPHGNSLELAVEYVPYLYSEELLGQVRDVLGSFRTSYKTSGRSRSGNLQNAASKVNGQTVYPGEVFSTISYMLPFTEENGYEKAHAYSGGRVIDSVGGGVCQISSTLYNAVLLAELDVQERYHHAMIVTYVPLSQDATVSESSGLDFVWMNSSDYPVYVECYTTEGKEVVVNLYGVETRSADRRVEYVSEELSSEPAEGEVIYTDADKPAGFIEIQAAHTGHKAQLWKVTYENGKEVSRVQVNESHYRSAPRSATVGTKTDNTVVAQALLEAVATNDIDYVKGIVRQIANGTFHSTETP